MKKMKSFITGTVALSMVLTTLLPTTALAADVHDEVAESEVVENVASTVSDVVDTAGDTVQDVVDSIPTYTVPEALKDAPAEEEEVPSETPEEEPKAEEPETSVEVTTKTSEDEMSDVVSSETESHTRLFVMSEEELTEFYGASSVDYYEGVYAITYADAETCMKAFSSFMAAGRTVEYDDSVEAFNEETVEDKTTVSEEVTSIEDNNVTSDETTTEVVEDVTTVEESIDTTKQRQIRVALIDTGVDTTNESLQGHIADGYDTSNMSDVNGHGTLMAEIIASNTNENVKIVPYQVFNENGKATVGATYYALLKAINEQVDVISLSVSGYGTSNMLTSAIAKAKEAGIYVVVAAGNDGDSADNYMPGNISDSITVSAVSIGEDGNKTLASYSNHGSVIDYSALGTIVKDKGTEDVSDDEVYEGTSISAANVSSYIATMLQYIKDDESTDNDEVLNALNSTIEDLGEAGRDDSFGTGYLSFEGIQKYITDKAQLEEEIVENEDEYPDEEGDIDFDFDEKDADQELETSDTYNASGEYWALAFIAAQNDLNAGKDAVINAAGWMNCASDYTLTVPSGRTLKIQAVGNNAVIGDIHIVNRGTLHLNGNGHILAIDGQASAGKSNYPTIHNYGYMDSYSGTVRVQGGPSNGITNEAGATFYHESGTLELIENGFNGLWNAGTATLQNTANCSKNGSLGGGKSGVRSQGGRCVINGGIYAYNANDGICNGAYISIKSANIYGNGRYGVQTSDSDAAQTYIESCTIHENSNVGVKTNKGYTQISASNLYYNVAGEIHNEAGTAIDVLYSTANHIHDSIAVLNSGRLRINNNNDWQNPSMLTSVDRDLIHTNRGAETVIEDGYYLNSNPNNNVCHVDTGGNLIINAGLFYSNDSAIYNDGKTVVNNGTIQTNYKHGIDNHGEVFIYAGLIRNLYSGGAALANSYKASIYGGKFTAGYDGNGNATGSADGIISYAGASSYIGNVTIEATSSGINTNHSIIYGKMDGK